MGPGLAAVSECPACGSGCSCWHCPLLSPLLSHSALLACQGLRMPLLEAEKRSVFIVVPVLVLSVLPINCLRSSTSGKEKTATLLPVISSAVSLSDFGTFSSGLSLGSCLMPLWGGVPRGAASMAGCWVLKGKVGRRPVEGGGCPHLWGKACSVKPVLHVLG